ncbi:MAG: efflux RND transporter periplasmic adaptor subunit [Deltaproteobacteria bacterium]|nr:efflux RND transporter periplasmic adaptor subunit [Deltaproteobacteria bacterium]
MSVVELSRTARWFRRITKLVLLAVLSLGAWWLWPEPVTEVRTGVVERCSVESLVQSVQAGELLPRRQVSLRAIVAGRISAIHVRRGDEVDKGKLLVELEAGTMLARMRLAQANYKAGESAIRTAEVRRNSAERSLARNKILASKGVLAAGALERFQAEFDFANEAVLTAEANLGQLRAAIDVARAALAETRVHAPFDGLVSQVEVEIGETVSPATPLLEIADHKQVFVKAPIDEADASRVQLGMRVKIQTDARGDRPVEGELAYISPVVLKDLRQNRQLNVEVRLANGAAAGLKIGMSADIEIVVDRRDDVLCVPTNVILRQAEERAVWVVAGGVATRRLIRTGLANWDHTEVVEGLREGERIIHSLQAEGLSEGVKVRLAVP